MPQHTRRYPGLPTEGNTQAAFAWLNSRALASTVFRVSGQPISAENVPRVHGHLCIIVGGAGGGPIATGVTRAAPSSHLRPAAAAAIAGRISSANRRLLARRHELVFGVPLSPPASDLGCTALLEAAAPAVSASAAAPNLPSATEAAAVGAVGSARRCRRVLVLLPPLRAACSLLLLH